MCSADRCLIPECEDPLQTEFRPPWLASAVPFSDGRPAGCHRYSAAAGATLPSNGSCVPGMFTGEEVACKQWVYPKSTLSIMSEVTSRGGMRASDWADLPCRAGAGGTSRRRRRLPV